MTNLKKLKVKARFVLFKRDNFQMYDFFHLLNFNIQI